MGAIWAYLVIFSLLMLVLALLFARHIIRRLDNIENGPPADRREETIFKLYSEIESMLDSFEEYVGEVHEEIEGEREELNELSRRASAIFLQSEGTLRQLSGYSQSPAPRQPEPQRPERAEAATRPDDDPPRSARLSARDRTTLGTLKTKSQKVRFLMSRGLALEEVARELNIGKGEVKLIADLDK